MTNLRWDLVLVVNENDTNHLLELRNLMIFEITMPIAFWNLKFRYVNMFAILAMLTLYGTTAIAGDALPSFTATTLSGKKVNSNKLLGQPTLLILTPSRNAAESTRKWVEKLRPAIDEKKYRICDVLVMDLPFFMSEEDAIDLVKKKIPKHYHDKTWIVNSQVMEIALGVPLNSDQAVIVVLDKNGKLILRVHGVATSARISQIVHALQSI